MAELSDAMRATTRNDRTANRKMIDASSRATSSGRPRAVMTPRWSFEASRADRMPPSAPALSRNGGTRTSSAGIHEEPIEPRLDDETGEDVERIRPA